MSLDRDDLLRRAFPDYDLMPEPPKFPPKWDESPPPCGEDPARNETSFPDLYLTIRGRAISAWHRLTNGEKQ